MAQIAHFAYEAYLYICCHYYTCPKNIFLLVFYIN